MGEIIGVGMDAVEIQRVLKAGKKETFLKKYYSSKEQELIANKHTRLATNFAGKEAVAKCLGTGFARIKPMEIEILRNENHAPYVVLSGAAKELAQKKEVRNILISLSDTKDMAFAYAICVK